MTAVTGRARTWVKVALAAWFVAVGVITMRPAPPDDETLGLAVRFIEWLASLGLPVTVPGMEASANVVMFVPFGVLAGLLLARPWWVVVLLGAATSGLIETIQRWLPTRYSTLQDLVMNTTGAAVGVLGLIAWVWWRRRRQAGSELRDPGLR